MALTSLFSLSVCGLGVTLCSSILEQATDKFYTVLERGQIGHEDATLNSLFLKLINYKLCNYLIKIILSTPA